MEQLKELLQHLVSTGHGHYTDARNAVSKRWGSSFFKKNRDQIRKLLDDIKTPKLKTTRVRTGSFSANSSSNHSKQQASSAAAGGSMSGYQKSAQEFLEAKKSTAKKRAVNKRLAAAAAMDGADSVLADLGVLRPHRKSHLRNESTGSSIEAAEDESSSIEI